MINMKRTLKTLSVVLPIGSLGLAPISCVAKQSVNSLPKENDVVVQCSPTVGHGFDFIEDTTPTVGQDYRCRFVSSTYELIEELPALPVHNELKPTDIEVVDNGQNIINECHLEHNVLIIPKEKMVEGKTLTINILGGEIADWISWEEISHISDLDIEDPEQELAKQYFQVGDYKRVYKKNKPISTARLLDFYADNYVYSEGTVLKERPAPFTFEMQKAFEKREWGGGEKVDLNIYLIPGWEYEGETGMAKLYIESQRMHNDNDFGLNTRPLDINPSNNFFSHFFPLSFTDYTGCPFPQHFDETHGDLNVDLSQGDNAKYAYYQPSKYKTIDTFYDKISKRNLNDKFYVRNIAGCSAGGTGTFYNMNFRMNSDGKKCNYESQHDKDEYWVFWAFCL